MRVDAAIIGGTGVGSRLSAMGGTPIHIPTPFGLARGRLLTLQGINVLLVQRHGVGHRTPPHRINYRAMAWAVKSLGARACFATAATGGLREDWPNGTIAICTDFVDLTGRNLTLYDRDVVHTDFSYPFAESARLALLSSAEELGVEVHDGGIYINGNGPRYETPYEIQLYRRIGGEVVGMTAATEAILMGEAGVPYACLVVVTNQACGLTGAALSHEEVVEEMESSAEVALEILLGAAAKVAGAK
jgi:5'-methylthioadenosine phosphorylase